ncbi:MAG TPA: phosphate/phosphite/phosphonate ABC transporter substrate-binding protein [Trebonia sp.]|nr:phosphate/phosphite/phosphonate ABC transporter substrate-binding protein [Trebonia sp.]
MRSPRISQWTKLAAAAIVTVAAVAACSSSSSSSAAAGAAAAGGTGNTVNSTWPTSVTLGEVGVSNATTLVESLKPLQDLLKAKMDLTLNVTTGTSYSAMIEAQEAGKAQLVVYGPFSYEIAVHQGVKIQNVGLVTSAPNTDGSYYSLAVVDPQRTPAVTSLKDAAGKKVCFSDPASTSGYLYPSYGLLEDHISPTTGVTPVFAGNDTTTAVDVANGSCQIGFSNTDDLPPAFTKDHVSKSAIKVIWTSPKIPASPIAVSDSLPQSFRTTLENVLVNDGNSAYFAKAGYCASVTACTAETGQYGYANPNLANYTPILTICAVTKSASCNV